MRNYKYAPIDHSQSGWLTLIYRVQCAASAYARGNQKYSLRTQPRSALINGDRAIGKPAREAKLGPKIYCRIGRFAIPAEGSETGERWDTDYRKAISFQGSRRAAVSSAHSLSNVRCHVVVWDMWRICVRAGSVVSTAYKPIVVDPTDSIAISTAWCVSSETILHTADRSCRLSPGRVNCAASGHFRCWTGRVALHSALACEPRYLCEELAVAPDTRGTPRIGTIRQRDTRRHAALERRGAAASLCSSGQRYASATR